MKTKLFFITIFLSTFSIKAQLTENFEGSVFPPTGWTTFVGVNGEGDSGYHNWTRYSNSMAMCRPDDTVTAGETSQDWLVSHQFTVDAAAPMISFALMDFDGAVKGSIYTIRVSTTSQTTHADFTIEQTYLESDLTPFDFTPHLVDLTNYVGQNIYVAFVMEQNNGDYMLVDDVNMVANSNASVDDNFLTSTVKVYPTIVEEYFTIENNSSIELTNMSIIDLNGRIVLQESLNNLLDAKKINTSTLTSGQYLVKINAGNTMTVRKIVIK